MSISLTCRKDYCDCLVVCMLKFASTGDLCRKQNSECPGNIHDSWYKKTSCHVMLDQHICHSTHGRGREWRTVVMNCCPGETPPWTVYCCSGARLSALSLSGHLVPLFPCARWGAQAAGRGGSRGAEAGKGLLRLPSAPRPPLGGEGAGWWRTAWYWSVLPAVCADGVQRREAKVHPGNRGASWLRYDSAHSSCSKGGM